MERECCDKCIWSLKRHFDVDMRYCKLKVIEVWSKSVPCPDYEGYDERF